MGTTGRPYIVLGDKTSHGGTVITADFTSLIDGKAMARIGDKVVCPKCKGVFAIKQGAPSILTIEGTGYARHMDMTDCGANLIASQVTAMGVNEQSPGHANLTASPPLAAPTESGICLSCLRKAAHLGSPTVIRD